MAAPETGHTVSVIHTSLAWETARTALMLCQKVLEAPSMEVDWK